MGMEQKRVLFMSISAGQGHNATCKAVIESLEERGIRTHMIDTLRYVNRAAGFTIDKGYEMLTKVWPELFGMGYRSALHSQHPNTPAGRRQKATLHRNVAPLLTEKLYRLIRNYDPHVVVMPHPFTCIMASALREKGYLRNATLISIITDYTIHPYEELTDVDYYVLAAPQFAYEAIKRGIPEEKLLTYGIPVRPSFYKKKDKKQAREELGWGNRSTLMVMGGSMGNGDIKDMISGIDSLPQDIQIACVCGKNKRIYNAIESMRLQKPLYNYGYTDRISDMMDASDVLISKPGGLTSSEAFAKNIPMVIFSPIHGQEDYNMEFFVNMGLAMRVSEFVSSDEVLFQMLHSPWRLEQIKEAQRELGIDNATERLTDFIEECPIRHSI
jgi:processive 1,2-diacylglycerol beta-glucosyltransferase